MPEAHKIDIKHVAKLARLTLDDEDAKHYADQLNRILNYIDTLTKYDLDGVEPTAHAIPVYDVLRADEPRPGLPQELALANAPKRVADQIQIPQVIE